MPPKNTESVTLSDEDTEKSNEVEPLITEETHSQKRPPMKIIWLNALVFALLHLSSLYALVLIPKSHPLTWLFTVVVYLVAALGVTAGSHRLWSHKAYKAKLPLRVILAIAQTISLQRDIYEWSRDHRVHHKFSETDADPHNAKRGFFFSHIGWLMVKKHPDVIRKGKQLDMSDLLADPVVRFQRKFYLIGGPLLCFAVPALIPHWLWGESLWNAFFLCGLLRYCFALNVAWLVNSAAHMWGNRPYDIRINPRQNIGVTIMSIGEGFHNYHHIFPQDYGTSEYGWHLNITTMFIDCMAWLGLAYARTTIPIETVLKRKKKTGDGTD